MHALTIKLYNSGDTVYCAIPTFYDASRFIFCKAYIESTAQFKDTVYYHLSSIQLLSNPMNVLETLSVARLKVIQRSNGKPTMITLAGEPWLQLTETNQQEALLARVGAEYLYDIPAPFACGSIEELRDMRDKISNFFREQSNKLLTESF